MRAQRAPRLVDGAIAARAAQQYGVISHAQLVELGLATSTISRRIASGRLQPLHRGVYAVGHKALRREGWWMAAVLAAGPGAALSYRSAAAFWAMRNDTRMRIDVSVPRHRRSTARLEVHHVEIQDDEVRIEDGIRVTTPARTLFDLAAVVPAHQLEAAFNEPSIADSPARSASMPSSRATRDDEAPKPSDASSASTGNTARRAPAATSSASSARSSTPTTCPVPRSTATPPTASSTPAGPSTGSSSNATATPPTAHARPSRTTGRETGP
jgi:hypothetical protein